MLCDHALAWAVAGAPARDVCRRHGAPLVAGARHGAPLVAGEMQTTMGGAGVGAPSVAQPGVRSAAASQLAT
jgi:hypothetical protein